MPSRIKLLRPLMPCRSMAPQKLKALGLGLPAYVWPTCIINQLNHLGNDCL